MWRGSIQRTVISDNMNQKQLVMPTVFNSALIFRVIVLAKSYLTLVEAASLLPSESDGQVTVVGSLEIRSGVPVSIHQVRVRKLNRLVEHVGSS